MVTVVTWCNIVSPEHLKPLHDLQKKNLSKTNGKNNFNWDDLGFFLQCKLTTTVQHLSWSFYLSFQRMREWENEIVCILRDFILVDVACCVKKHKSPPSSGFFKGHQGSQGQICGLHQGLRGSHTHGLWAQPQHSLHRVFCYYQEAEGGVGFFAFKLIRSDVSFSAFVLALTFF